MTARDRIRTTHALVLRRRDVGDADRVVTVFAPREGKIEVLAKGVRKTTSRKAGHLEPFMHVTLVLAQARTWDIVTEAAALESFRHLRENLDAIARATYVVEMVDHFSDAGDDNQPLWELALYILRELDAIAASDRPQPPLLLRWFDLQLLSLSGFQPQLFHCVGCGSDLAAVVNFLSLAAGGVFCPNCGAQRNDVEPIQPDSLKVLRFLQSQPWQEAQRLAPRPAVIQTVESVLQRFVSSVVERHLRTPEFLRRLEGMRRAP